MIEKNYTYRIGNLNDLEQLKALTWLAYSQFNDVISNENLKKWELNLTKDDTYLILLKTATCFVCEHNDKIVGTAFLVPQGNATEMFQSDWAYIRLVGVNPNNGGQGIGKQLTQMCLDRAKETGEKTIALHTSEFQNAARHIYESLGFKKQKEFELYDKKYWIYTLEL